MILWQAVIDNNLAHLRVKSGKDGKRVAGKQKIPPPGSGGSRPNMAPRDLDSIRVRWRKRAATCGSHIHDRYRTGTEVGKPRALVDSHAKVTGQA